MRPQPLIAVTDVEASSRWYQTLLGCESAHGGKEYERLVKNGVLVMQLHAFTVDHHHGPIGDPSNKPYGNGVLLWFEVDDFDACMTRIAQLNAHVVLPRHRNPPESEGDGGPNHWECWLRDPDGYTVVVASPDGTGSGEWRPDPQTRSIAPMLSVRGGARAIEFYKAAFDARELFRIDDPAGAVVAKLGVGHTEFWLADESPEHSNFSPESLSGGTVRMVMTVDDPDAAYDRAIGAGAAVVWPVRDEYGWRLGRLVDPFGHHWEIGKPLQS